MGLRPAHCYKEPKKPAFTRIAITVPDRNYIGASPAMRIRQFNMGNPLKEFSHIIDLRTMSEIQIRDNAIEAMRQTLNRFFHNNVGKDSYFMKIRVYPHQILRENKQATGAGADRIQKGMSHPYGRPIGRAIRVHKGQKILSVLVDEEKLETAKVGLERAGPKLGCKTSLRIGTDVASIGTKPKTVREIVETKKETTETTPTEGATPAADAKGKGETKGDAKKEEVKAKAEAKPEAKGKTEAKGKK